MNKDSLNNGLHVRLNDEDKSKIKEIAEGNDCSMSETLRFMIILARKSQLGEEYGWKNSHTLLDNEE